MDRKPVEIQWIDAKTWSNDWLEEQELASFTLPEYMSYGIVVKEDATSIFLAQTIGDESRNIIGIHKGCIVKTRRLK